MTSPIGPSNMFRLPDDADATRLCVYEAVMRIRDRCTAPNKPEEPELQRKLPDGYEWAVQDKMPQKDTVLEYIRKVRDNHAWPLYIHGPPGVGKTCIAALMYSRCTGSALWLRADTTLKEMGFATPEQSQAWRKSIKQTTCIFLDDLGVQAPNPQMLVALFDLLEDRKGRPLVITGNHSMQSLSQIYEARIVSRLSAGSILWIDGGDRRKGQGDAVKIGGGK